MRFKISGVLHILLIVFMAFLTLILYWSIFMQPKLQRTLLDYYINSLSHQLDLAIYLVNIHYSNYLQGLEDERTAKQNAMRHLRNIFYGPEGKDYFFVLNMDGVLLVHPYRSDLEGQNAFTSDDAVFTSAVRTIVQGAKEGKKFVEYDWYLYGEEKVEKKFTVIRIFEPWGWIIGTGLYSKTLLTESKAIATEFQLVAVVMLMVYSAILVYLLVLLNRQYREKEELLRLHEQEEERLRTLLNSIPQPVVVFRNSQNIFMNEPFKQTFVQKEGSSGLESKLLRTIEELSDEMSRTRQSSVNALEIEVGHEKKWFDVHAMPLFTKGNLVETVFVLVEITQRVEQIEFWKSKAETDPLTGLANRNVLDVLLRDTRVLGERFCVIMLDVDGFKEINDRYGHNVGDEVLKEFAQRLSNNARKDSILVRFGGDEMLLIVPNADRKIGLKIAQRLQEVLKEPLRLGDLTLNLSASMGFSEFPTDGNDLATLINVADQRLYKAKNTGKGVLCMD
ncbi:MAG: diguanylate cyclase [Pseudothermotoga sp.]|uniref:diguanylate cyclase n=1 Tax=Pseudothermotoga sp. TaxID=2033661 RepID=UPI000B18C0DE|nr:diguanylate cyclase [Pseudothermotoga sp.]